MSCNNPKKAFVVGKLANGKNHLIICDYRVHHLEEIGDRFERVYHSNYGRERGRSYYDFIEIPCGTCLSCLLNRSRTWADRCLLEMKDYKDNCFVTLTYDDEHLPHNGSGFPTLVKKDLQDFLKRLRKDYKCRFFACGEYGDQSARPHYHLILFGYKPDDLKLFSENELGDKLYTSEYLTKKWNNGHVLVGEATYESAAYVSRYVTKKSTKGLTTSYFKKLDVVPEFINMSRKPGIGGDSFKESLYDYNFFYIGTENGSRSMRPSRYFDKLLEKQNVDRFKRIKDSRLAICKENARLKISKTDLDYFNYLQVCERNLEAKTKVLTRKEV